MAVLVVRVSVELAVAPGDGSLGAFVFQDFVECRDSSVSVLSISISSSSACSSASRMRGDFVACVDRLLGQPHGQLSRCAAISRASARASSHQPVGVHDPVDQPPGLGLLRADAVVAGQQHFLGALRAAQEGQQQGDDAAAEFHFGFAEAAARGPRWSGRRPAPVPSRRPGSSRARRRWWAWGCPRSA